MREKEELRKFIRKNYADVARKSSGCCCGSSCGSSCCCRGDGINVEEVSEKIGYTKDDLANVPSEANMGLGCGNPIAIASLKRGEIVLDLGCGGGIDCFLALNKVGDQGFVIGVDMTPDMITLARENARKSGYTNIDFRLGEIEHLPVEDQMVDVIISNCVINLSVDKNQVFREAYRVLKKGGRLAISDVLAIAEIPEKMRTDLSLVAGCISGAQQVELIRDLLVSTGFREIVLTPKENSKEIVSSWVPGMNIEDYVASYIIEAKK